MELVDTLVLGTSAQCMGVRVPPPLPRRTKMRKIVIPVTVVIVLGGLAYVAYYLSTLWDALHKMM